MQDVTKDRDKYIGGSDIPAIMGMSPFRTRWDILEEKAGLGGPDFAGNPYTEYGNIMEPKIRDHVGGTLGSVFLEDKKIVERDDVSLRYHADGWDGHAVLEIKTTSQVSPTVGGYERYLVQLLFGMEMYNTGCGVLAVYSRPEDFSEEFDEKRLQIFTVKSEDYIGLTSEINHQLMRFIEDVMRLRRDPFLTEEDLQPKEIVEAAKRAVMLEDQLALLREVEQSAKVAKAKLKTAMETYGIKRWIMNNGTKITLVDDVPPKQKEVLDEKRLKKEQPDIYKAYTTTVESGGRAGYVKITPCTR